MKNGWSAIGLEDPEEQKHEADAKTRGRAGGAASLLHEVLLVLNSK